MKLKNSRTLILISVFIAILVLNFGYISTNLPIFTKEVLSLDFLIFFEDNAKLSFGGD